MNVGRLVEEEGGGGSDGCGGAVDGCGERRAIAGNESDVVGGGVVDTRWKMGWEGGGEGDDFLIIKKRIMVVLSPTIQSAKQPAHLRQIASGCWVNVEWLEPEQEAYTVNALCCSS